MSLEILRNGLTVGGHSWLLTTRSETGRLRAAPWVLRARRSEFRYLAEIRDASCDAAQYEARVTIR